MKGGGESIGKFLLIARTYKVTDCLWWNTFLVMGSRQAKPKITQVRDVPEEVSELRVAEEVDRM